MKYFAIATMTRKGNLRRVPDTKFSSYEAAEAYGLKYHTDRYSVRFFAVVDHPDSTTDLQDALDTGLKQAEWLKNPPKCSNCGNDMSLSFPTNTYYCPRSECEKQRR